MGSASAHAVLPGGITALQCAVELDGRVTWYPDNVRGVAPSNSYVVREGDEALLVDTGVTAHRDELLALLEPVLDGVRALSVAHTRPEYFGMCNTVAVAERWPVTRLHGIPDGFVEWLELRTASERPAHDPLGQTECVYDAPELAVDGAGRRVLESFRTPLRLLPVRWLYDVASRTLFTADSFTHLWSRSRTGPWIASDGDEPVAEELVRAHLLTKFEWLCTADDLAPIVEGVAAFFDTHDVATIAPAYGAILQGREVVERHRAALTNVLEALAQEATARSPRGNR